jgi:hypothetical protein
MPAAFFVVSATVADPAKRAAFDAWYSREHLPDALKSFGAERAWRRASPIRRCIRQPIGSPTRPRWSAR